LRDHRVVVGLLGGGGHVDGVDHHGVGGGGGVLVAAHRDGQRVGPGGQPGGAVEHLLEFLSRRRVGVHGGDLLAVDGPVGDAAVVVLGPDPLHGRAAERDADCVAFGLAPGFGAVVVAVGIAGTGPGVGPGAGVGQVGTRVVIGVARGLAQVEGQVG